MNPILTESEAEFRAKFGGEIHGWRDGIITTQEVESFLKEKLTLAYEAGKKEERERIKMWALKNENGVGMLHTDALLTALDTN
jgi:hypothetical protein